MKRFLINFDDAKKELVNRIFLLNDPDLMTIEPNADGTVKIVPITNTGKFSNENIDGFLRYCKDRKQELLVEISEADFNLLTDEAIVRRFVKLENGSFYEDGATFTPRILKLIDYGAYNKIKKAYKNFKIVSILPSVIEQGKYFVTEKSSFMSLSEVPVLTRAALNKRILGADLYLEADDPRIIGLFKTWITEVKEERKYVYNIINKNYFLFKGFDELEKDDVPAEISQFINEVYRKSVLVYITHNPAMIYQIDDENAPKDAEIMAMVRREDLDDFIMKSLNLPYKEYFTVFNQSENGFKEITLEEALNISN